MQPFALDAGKGRTFVNGIPHVFKLGELDPGRGVAIFELDTCPGEEPPLHTHATEDEWFYVLEGEVEFHCAGQDFPLHTGGFMFLPRGLQHGYTLKSPRVRLLIGTNPVREEPGGWEGYAGEVERGPQPS